MAKIFSVAMLVVGTIIGAGFASGREIVAFFGEVPPLAIAALAGLMFFAFSAVFLYVGKRVSATNVSAVNAQVFGKLSPVPDIIVLLNSAISLAAMLAGFDSLFGTVTSSAFPFSVIAALISVAVVVRGIKGLLRVNIVIVPLLILLISAVCIGSTSSPIILPLSPISGAKALVYVGMNMLLAASVLTTVSDLSTKQILAASLVSAAIIALLVLFITLALGSTDAGNADMPLVSLSHGKGRAVYIISVISVAAGIFTTMITAHASLTEWLAALGGTKFFAAVISVLFTLALAQIGFRAVVDNLYPALGVMGVAYFLFSAAFLIRHRLPLKPTPENTLDNAHRKVHKRGKHAKNHR